MRSQPLTHMNLYMTWNYLNNNEVGDMLLLEFSTPKLIDVINQKNFLPLNHILVTNLIIRGTIIIIV